MAIRRRYANNPRYSRNAGREAAERHIAEGREFERELGGSVSDIKAYFFGLSGAALQMIFRAYGNQYGADAEGYARQTFVKWKDGTTQMS